MPIKGTDYLVVNRDNVDYKALVSDLNIPTDNAELANGANYITLAEVPEVDLDDYALKTEIPVDNTELTNGAGYITLSEVPEPDLEGALIFRGTVANEGELPGDAVVGDLYYNEEDGLLYAKGESEWHALGEVAEVDLDGYATETWVESKGYITIDEVPEVDLDPYALKTEIPTDNADLANGAGYITASDLPEDVDLDGYATEEWVEAQGYLTDVPDVDAYTKAEADAKFMPLDISKLPTLS